MPDKYVRRENSLTQIELLSGATFFLFLIASYLFYSNITSVVKEQVLKNQLEAYELKITEIEADNTFLKEQNNLLKAKLVK